MELQPTPFPVKSKYMNPKSTRNKNSEATKTSAKYVPPLLSQKRVFGTARNPNIPSKPKAKSSCAPLKKALKSPQKAPISEANNNSSDKTSTKTKSKSVCFKEDEPRTPAKTPAKTRLSSTPYRTAEKCSKCRFDRLETSAYWLGQIKLSESVGKHFVSVEFFKLALECKAEPIRNIRVELKKYLARHEYLNDEDEWKKLGANYGLVKEDSSVKTGDRKAGVDEENAIVLKDLQNEISNPSLEVI